MPQVRNLLARFGIPALAVLLSFAAPVQAEENEPLKRIKTAFTSLFPQASFEAKPSFDITPTETVAFSQETGRVALEVREHAEPNAFALPADRMNDNTARIIIHSALLDALASNAELSFVLAHELAHLRHDHFRIAMPAFTLSSAQLQRIVAIEHEWEMTADSEAIELLRKRGIDPRGALSLLGKLRSSAHSEEIQSFRSHPAIKERITQIHQKLTQAVVRP